MECNTKLTREESISGASKKGESSEGLQDRFRTGVQAEGNGSLKSEEVRKGSPSEGGLEVKPNALTRIEFRRIGR